MTTPTQEVKSLEQPNEAGFSTNFFLTHPKMGRLQFTFRGARSWDWEFVLIDMRKFVTHMIEDGWQFDGDKIVPQATAPQPDPAAKIAEQEGNKAMAQELQTQAEAVPHSRKGENIQYQTIDIDIVEVLPQPDNKVTIKFYRANDKYPRISVNKWKLDAANGLMKHVTSEDMAKAAKYSLRCRVYYTDGSTYQTTDNETRHYKDVEHVRPI